MLLKSTYTLSSTPSAHTQSPDDQTEQSDSTEPMHQIEQLFNENVTTKQI